MNVKPNHPLTELLAKLLHSIETVPAKEQRRMANRACREATKWHKKQVSKLEWWVYDMEKQILSHGDVCPECDVWLEFHKHKEDCGLFLLVSRIKKKMEIARDKK